MLPADEDIARTSVVVDCFLDAFWIITIAARVDRQAEILSQGLDRLEGTVSLSIYTRQRLEWMRYVDEDGSYYQILASAPGCIRCYRTNWLRRQIEDIGHAVLLECLVR